MKKESDATSNARFTMGKKPHKIRIKARGHVDGRCEGKNAWDYVMRTLIHRILDINVVKWESHELKSLYKMWATLDKEFQYMENELFIVGFKNVVQKWFKI
jgi:hypothetical protein